MFKIACFGELATDYDFPQNFAFPNLAKSGARKREKGKGVREKQDAKRRNWDRWRSQRISRMVMLMIRE